MKPKVRKKTLKLMIRVKICSLHTDSQVDCKINQNEKSTKCHNIYYTN